MIPILYDYFERDFTSAGIGRLEECISCTVTEVINGEYECEFVYPITGKWFDRLVNLGCLIAVTHDHNGDIQPFEVYRYSAPIDGVVTFNAHHISYRLSNLICTSLKPGVPFALGGSTPQMLFDRIGPLALTQNDFSFEDYSEYAPGYAAVVYNGYTSIRDAFLNGKRVDDPVTGSEALYKVFPGEFLWDKFTVKYYRKRGASRGVQIRYGKNMSEVTRERDSSNLVSSVFPYWISEVTWQGGVPAFEEVYGDQTFSPYCEVNYAEWTSGIYQMETPDGEPYFFGAADIRAVAIDFSQDYQTAPTKEELRLAALDWMSKNSTWRAFDNITVRFVDLYNSADYEDVREIEKCSVGDYVDVIYTALGIVSQNVEIVSGTYDVLSDSFVEMELGEIKTTYADLIYNMIGGNKA